MTRIKNYSLELELAEKLRLEARVPLVQVFRVRVKDILTKEKKIIFRTKYNYTKKIKIDKHLMNSIMRFTDDKNLLPINYLFFTNSKRDAIGKSEYFTILWNKARLGHRPKIERPNIDAVYNELSSLLPREVLHPEQEGTEIKLMD